MFDLPSRILTSSHRGQDARSDLASLVAFQKLRNQSGLIPDTLTSIAGNLKSKFRGTDVEESNVTKVAAEVRYRCKSSRKPQTADSR